MLICRVWLEPVYHLNSDASENRDGAQDANLEGELYGAGLVYCVRFPRALQLSLLMSCPQSLRPSGRHHRDGLRTHY